MNLLFIGLQLPRDFELLKHNTSLTSKVYEIKYKNKETGEILPVTDIESGKPLKVTFNTDAEEGAVFTIKLKDKMYHDIKGTCFESSKDAKCIL